VTTVEALLLRVGADLYALPVGWAREVVGAPAVTPLATAPSLLLGLFNLRGQIVPLLDTAAVLGTGRTATTTYVVVVGTAQGLVGLATTALPRRELLDEPAGPTELAGTTGLYRVGHEVAALLDPTVLLSPEGLRGNAARAELATTSEEA